MHLHQVRARLTRAGWLIADGLLWLAGSPCKGKPEHLGPFITDCFGFENCIACQITVWWW